MVNRITLHALPVQIDTQTHTWTQTEWHRDRKAHRQVDRHIATHIDILIVCGFIVVNCKHSVLCVNRPVPVLFILRGRGQGNTLGEHIEEPDVTG